MKLETYWILTNLARGTTADCQLILHNKNLPVGILSLVDKHLNLIR
jgi:hypothetical protein